MIFQQTRDKLTAAALGIGAAVPLIYFGIQIAASPFYPGYNIMFQAASELGSDKSSFPALFNVGAISTGIAALLASLGFLRALPRLGAAPVLALLTALALASLGLGSLKAGFFPLPDPRHNPGPIGIGMFLIPPLFAAVLRKRSNAGLLKTYLIANLILFLALIPIMGGMLHTRVYQGLLQRVAAMVVFLPVGVVSYSLLRGLVRLEHENMKKPDLLKREEQPGSF